MIVTLALVALVALLLLSMLLREPSEPQNWDALDWLRDEESEAHWAIRAQRLEAERQMRRLADRRPGRP